MNIYIFGNGNISFTQFKEHYESVINEYIDLKNVNFLLCDFRGVDVLAMEVLKCDSANVSVYHIGENQRYLSDKLKMMNIEILRL